MDDNQNEWGDEETLDTKRFRVSQGDPELLSLVSVLGRGGWVGLKASSPSLA